MELAGLTSRMLTLQLHELAVSLPVAFGELLGVDVREALAAA